MTDILERAPMEVELKYRMTDVTTGVRLLASEELAGLRALGPVVRVEHEDRYLDTPDGALELAGYAGRLRGNGEATILALKSLARQDDGGAGHRRLELEGPADETSSPSGWPESPARDALLGLIGDVPLVELVALRQVRHKRDYGHDGTRVEVSVDEVDVLHGPAIAEHFIELELELREGDEAALEPLADMLGEIEELVPVTGSKFERALDAIRHGAPDADGQHGLDGVDDELADTDLAGSDLLESDLLESDSSEADLAGSPFVAGVLVASGADDAPTRTGRSGAQRRRRRRAAHSIADQEVGAVSDGQHHALVAVPMEIDAGESGPAAPRILVPKSPGVLPDDHLAEAGRKVLRFHLARMITREAGTREGSDPEELHAMRVATRRQRAAWRVFGDAFEPKRTARHRKRLRFVAADLGAVRDLDVLIEAVEAYQKRQPRDEAAALEPLVREWRQRREVARDVLVRELDSERYRRWLDAYIAFVQSEGQGVHAVGPTEPHRVRDTMPSRIWASYERVRAYEPVMRWADVSTLHELRIAAKWLRYTLEFVRDALGRDAGPVIERVVALQDHIGWLHDADVAAGLARAFLVEHAGDLTEQESAAIGRYLVERERALARLRRTVGAPWRGVASPVFRRALGRLVADV